MQPGAPYPGQQPPVGQPGRHAAGRPVPGPAYYQQQVPYPGPPAPRRSRRGLVVLIVLAVVVVLGGGTAAYFLFVKSGPSPAGRYAVQPACTKLSAPPYRFVGSPAAMDDGALKENCTANLGNEPTDGSAIVEVDIYPGQGGVGIAQRDTIGDSQTVPGTGFENPLNATYQAATVAGNYCSFDYYRSNEYVEIGFNYVAGVHSRDDCVSVALPYVKQLYSQIG